MEYNKGNVNGALRKIVGKWIANSWKLTMDGNWTVPSIPVAVGWGGWGVVQWRWFGLFT